MTGNDVRVLPFGHGIMLIDQGRLREAGGLYKTRLNTVSENTIRYEGAGRSGGTSDRPPGTENAGIIENGGNGFDRNTYIAAGGKVLRFLSGYEEMTFDGFRHHGQETHGRIVPDQ